MADNTPDDITVPPPDALISPDDGRSYWQSIDADVDGMLGGFAYISRADLQGSRAFLAKLGIGAKGGLRTVTRALEGGAGYVPCSHFLRIPLARGLPDHCPALLRSLSLSCTWGGQADVHHVLLAPARSQTQRARETPSACDGREPRATCHCACFFARRPPHVKRLWISRSWMALGIKIHRAAGPGCEGPHRPLHRLCSHARDRCSQQRLRTGPGGWSCPGVRNLGNSWTALHRGRETLPRALRQARGAGCFSSCRV